MPRARSRLIARPRPTPSRVRVKFESTCTNGSKINSSFSGGMPMPVSLTRMRMRCATPSSAIGEFHRVREQVEDDLLEFFAVSANGQAPIGRRVLIRHALGAHLRHDERVRGSQYFVDRHLLDVVI